MRAFLSLIAPMLLLSACDSGGDAPAEQAPAASTTPSPSAAPSSAPLAAEIPAAFHGRWDMNAMACGQDVSEMRLTIAADGLRFYESVAKVDAVSQPAPARLEIDAAVDAEGMTQGRHISLVLRDDGRLATTINETTALRVRCDGVVPR